MKKERAIKEIISELSYPYIHEDVKNHYIDLLNCVEKKDYDGFKILVFQPVCAGDHVVSSLGAELLCKKFPGSIIHYLVEAKPAISILEANPFIDKVFQTDNWEVFMTRDTTEEHRDGKKSEVGSMLKEYDLGLNLYWWNPPMVKSFLEDLGLPTDYTRVKIYPTIENKRKAISYLTKFNDKEIIGLQANICDKWGGNYNELKTALEGTGNNVVEIDSRLGSYVESAAVMQACDLVVCSEGSVSHVAAAVGTPTVTLSSIYKPEDVCVEFYQNKYLLTARKHQTVRPHDFCGNHRCITYNPDNCVHKNPPYSFPINRFPPYMYKECDYKGIKTNCIKENTSVKDIMDKVNLSLSLKD